MKPLDLIYDYNIYETINLAFHSPIGYRLQGAYASEQHITGNMPEEPEHMEMREAIAQLLIRTIAMSESEHRLAIVSDYQTTEYIRRLFYPNHVIGWRDTFIENALLLYSPQAPPGDIMCINLDTVEPRPTLLHPNGDYYFHASDVGPESYWGHPGSYRV